MYPLRFAPLYKNYLWGGRRLQTILGKSLPPGSTVAESWEIVDHAADQSLVLAGEWQGMSLGELVLHHNRELLGRHAGVTRFPLLLKFLDAQQPLSVQVHPNDEQAARLVPPDLGKTEAWVVLHAEPGSAIYAGLKRGFDRAALAREVARGTTELCLHRFEPRPGDCVLLPAGTVHALGAGLVIAEIQQSSDTTYRLFDWNRVGADGRPRALHVEQALAVIDYDRGPVNPLPPRPTDRPHVTRLAACDKFVLDRWTFDAPQTIGGDERFHVMAILSGQVQLEGDAVGQPLGTGETALIPACMGAVELRPMGTVVLLAAALPA